MIVRYQGPGSELNGTMGILNIRNGKLVSQRLDGLKLMEISKWARTVMSHESILRELEADIRGLGASARPKWLDAVESLMLAWDQFRELVRAATGR